VTRSVRHLFGAHAGICAIVGSGPSILELTAEHLCRADFVIALNHAIVAVEALGLTVPVYASAKDDWGYHAVPSEGVPVLQSVTVDESPMRHEPRYVFDEMADFAPLQIAYDAMSAPVAIAIAASMGAWGVELVCFDSLVGDDRKADGAGNVFQPLKVYGPGQNVGLRYVTDFYELPCLLTVPGICEARPLKEALPGDPEDSVYDVGL
jgi:hypothetical protein